MLQSTGKEIPWGFKYNYLNKFLSFLSGDLDDFLLLTVTDPYVDDGLDRTKSNLHKIDTQTKA